jgi:hypothetical protein
VPLVGGPKGADERARIGQILNSRIPHAWRDRWVRATGV